MRSFTAVGLGSPPPIASWEQLWEHFDVTLSQSLSVKEVPQHPQLIIPDNISVRERVYLV